MKGQFLERPTLIPVGSSVLEGLSHRGERRPSVLLIPPAPSEGSMDDVLAAELAWSCAQAGHPELRFNFRGVGASQGTRGDLRARTEDAAAALELVEANAGGLPAVVVALGASAPVALALVDRRPSVRGLALIRPADIGWGALANVAIPLLVVLAQDGPQPRAVVSEAVQAAGGTLEVVASADAKFTRGLAEVGRALIAWLQSL